MIMRFRSYGGPWAEFRALVATILMGWASRISCEATMDVAASLSRLEKEPEEADR